MSEVTTEFQVEPFKITVSARGARSDGNYGSNEVFASVQQSIPDNVTGAQIEDFVARLVEPLKAAVEAALPEPAAPRAQSRPAASGGGSGGSRPVIIKSYSPANRSFGPAEDGPLAAKFAAEGDTSWVVPAALAEFPGVREVIYAEKRDKSGTYFQARGNDGVVLGYVNRPESGQTDPSEEPF